MVALLTSPSSRYAPSWKIVDGAGIRVGTDYYATEQEASARITRMQRHTHRADLDPKRLATLRPQPETNWRDANTR